MKEKVWMCEFEIFLILCRELWKSTRHRILCWEPKGGLSAHLTARPTAVTAVPLCREVSAVPRACFYNSRHSAFVSWVRGCAKSLLCSLSAQTVCTACFFCAESSIWYSRQSVPVPWALVLSLGTDYSSQHRLRFRYWFLIWRWGWVIWVMKRGLNLQTIEGNLVTLWRKLAIGRSTRKIKDSACRAPSSLLWSW
jgi:hypothetical protein